MTKPTEANAILEASLHDEFSTSPTLAEFFRSDFPSWLRPPRRTPDEPGRAHHRVRLLPPAHHAPAHETDPGEDLRVARGVARDLHPWLGVTSAGRTLRILSLRHAAVHHLEAAAAEGRVQREALARVIRAGANPTPVELRLAPPLGRLATTGLQLLVHRVRATAHLTEPGSDGREERDPCQDAGISRAFAKVDAAWPESHAHPEAIYDYFDALRDLIAHAQSLLLQGELDRATALVSKLEAATLTRPGPKPPPAQHAWFWRAAEHEAILALAWATSWLSLGGPYLTAGNVPAEKGAAVEVATLRAALLEGTQDLIPHVPEAEACALRVHAWFNGLTSGGTPSETTGLTNGARRLLPLFTWMSFQDQPLEERLLAFTPERPPATVPEATLVLRLVHDRFEAALREGSLPPKKDVDAWRPALASARRTFSTHGATLGLHLLDTIDLLLDVIDRAYKEAGEDKPPERVTWNARLTALFRGIKRVHGLSAALQVEEWITTAKGLAGDRDISPEAGRLVAEAMRAALNWRPDNADLWLQSGCPRLEYPNAPSKLRQRRPARVKPEITGPLKPSSEHPSLFLNVPYDPDYSQFFDVLECVAVLCGFRVLLAGDMPANARTEQFSNVRNALSTATHSLHEMARTNGEGPLSSIRANMAFEAGMAVGARNGDKILIVAPTAADLDRCLSDLNDRNKLVNWTKETYRTPTELAGSVAWFLGHRDPRRIAMLAQKVAPEYALRLLVDTPPQSGDSGQEFRATRSGRFRWGPDDRATLILTLAATRSHEPVIEPKAD